MTVLVVQLGEVGLPPAPNITEKIKSLVLVVVICGVVKVATLVLLAAAAAAVPSLTIGLALPVYSNMSRVELEAVIVTVTLVSVPLANL